MKNPLYVVSNNGNLIQESMGLLDFAKKISVAILEHKFKLNSDEIAKIKVIAESIIIPLWESALDFILEIIATTQIFIVIDFLNKISSLLRFLINAIDPVIAFEIFNK